MKPTSGITLDTKSLTPRLRDRIKVAYTWLRGRRIFVPMEISAEGLARELMKSQVSNDTALNLMPEDSHVN